MYTELFPSFDILVLRRHIVDIVTSVFGYTTKSRRVYVIIVSLYSLAPS